MHKNEFELQKLGIQSENYAKTISLIMHLVSVLGAVACVWIIINGILIMVESSPESLKALSAVVEKLRPDTIVGYVLASTTSVAWLVERKGKKRAYKKLADIRKKLEGEDPYKGSSNLDENGHTPG